MAGDIVSVSAVCLLLVRSIKNWGRKSFGQKLCCCSWLWGYRKKSLPNSMGGLRSQRGQIQYGRSQGHLFKNIPEYRHNGKDALYYTQFYSWESEKNHFYCVDKGQFPVIFNRFDLVVTLTFDLDHKKTRRPLSWILLTKWHGKEASHLIY